MSKGIDSTLPGTDHHNAGSPPEPVQPQPLPAEPEIGGIPRFVVVWMAIFVLGGVLCVISLLLR